MGTKRTSNPVAAPILVDIEIEGVEFAFGQTDHVTVIRAWAEPDPVIAYQRRTRPRDEARAAASEPPSKHFAAALASAADYDRRRGDFFRRGRTDLDVRVGFQALERPGEVLAKNKG